MVEQVKVGPLSVSPMGFGTWAGGNQFLWGYQESMDTKLQQTFNLVVDNGINIFDTANSYGTGRLNGKSENLLGKFIQEFQGMVFFRPFGLSIAMIMLSSTLLVIIKYNWFYVNSVN